MSVEIIEGDALQVLPSIGGESVQTCITSPPYYGLRDYGLEPVEWPAVEYTPMPGLAPISIPPQSANLGLEETIEAYVGHVVLIFRAVWDALADDGTVWLNLGDSYSGSGGAGGDYSENGLRAGQPKYRQPALSLRQKNLMGIPWRVAFALQADGWYLRSDIIWHKPNPMPESVTDRPTKAHEYLFLMSKSARYYYDADAARDKALGGILARLKNNGESAVDTKKRGTKTQCGTPSEMRNRRSVWSISTNGYPDAHFAVFPPKLVEPCVLACSKRGDTVLDPFFGAGTTGLVADRNGRHCIGIELSNKYAEMAEGRIQGDCPLFSSVTRRQFKEAP